MLMDGCKKDPKDLLHSEIPTALGADRSERISIGNCVVS